MVSSSNDGGAAVKFTCSYGGKILPRQTDGKLRYVGGETRVVAVDRSITFAELMVKVGELRGSSVNLRCQFPMEDLDALVSITSDEDLGNLIEEYDRASKAASKSLKIRAFLSRPKTIKTVSPPPSITSTTAVRSINTASVSDRSVVHQTAKPLRFPVYFQTGPKIQHRHYACLPQRNPRYYIYPANYWQ